VNVRDQLEQLLAAPIPAAEPLSGKRIAVYGAGNCGRSVASRARAAGFEVAAFIDARGEALASIDGRPCHAPKSTEAARYAAEGIPIILGIYNFAVDLTPILALLRQVGFRRIVTYYEFHELFDLPADFWLTPRSFYRALAPAILAGHDLFADEASRQTYFEAMALRLTHDPEWLSEPDQQNHYFPPDLPPLGEPLRMIDGGAFTGDTLSLFLEQKRAFTSVAAFEPDLGNFKMLAATANEHRAALGQAILFPCGLGARTELCTFHAGAGAGSAIAASGESHIQVVALDEVLPTFDANFIKLDIEGAEPAALRGGVQLVRRCRPVLAICVYHQPAHLWEIPQLIDRLFPGYRLALRAHQFNGFDLVAYAFPC
jgi:FkbM family methyltransferase